MNLFKKIFQKKPEEEKKENKTLFYKEIPDWIEKEKEQISSEEKEITQKINEKINLFIKEIKEKSQIAKDVDLNSKKAEGRLKSINEDGRKKYFEFLEDFTEKLKNPKGKSLSQLQEEINKLFLDFNKLSYKNYQRATILIGKEMADIKQLIKKMSEELFGIFDTNKEIIISKKRIFSIEKDIQEFNEKEKEEKKFLEELKNNKKQVEKEKEEKEKILFEIEKIKNSEEYKENLENKREIAKIKGEVEKEIFELKQEIDFKKLSNFYHSLEEGLESVKKFRDNFLREFSEENGDKKLTTLLKDVKMFTEKIENKFLEIKNLKEEIKVKKQKITKDKIPEKELNLESTNSRIEELEKEKLVNESNSKNIKINKEELIQKIKGDLSEFSIELKD